MSTTLWRVKATVLPAHGIEITSTPESLIAHVVDADVDVVRFGELLKLAEVPTGLERIRALQRAEAAYGGDLLEECEEDWCEEDRVHLRTLYVRLLRSLMEAHKSSGEYRLAIECARRVVERELLDEDTHRELMVLHHLVGDRAAALAQYENLRTLLQRELGIRPAPPTTELWEYIRSQEGSVPLLPSRPPGVGEEPALFGEFDQVPIVGRQFLLASLAQALARVAHGRGEAVVISGEAGIGKTRLVEAVATEARLRGFDVLQGNCPDLQDPPPYQALVQALWPRVSMIQRRPGNIRSVLSGVFDVLAAETHHPPRPALSEQPVASLDNAMLIEMLLSLLEPASGGLPTMLVLEDMHRVDKASMELLVSLLRRLSKLKILVMATVRAGEGSANQTIAALLANGAWEIQLPQLSEEETTQLVRNALDSRNVTRAIARFVWEHTNGIPLFGLEFLRFLQSRGYLNRDGSGHWSLSESAIALKPTDIPSRIHEVIRRRIELLDHRLRVALSQAAILGIETDYDQLREFTQLHEDEFLECMDRLVGAHVLLETKTGFRFPHENARLAALSVLRKSRSRVLHLKAAAFLERTSPGKTEDLCWHYEEAGNLEKALLNAEASGDKARLVYANRDAVSWYSRALDLLAALDKDSVSGLRKRAGLLLKRQGVLDLVGDRQRQSADVDAIHAIAQRLGDRPLSAQAFYVRAILLARMNSDNSAIKLANRSAQLFRAAGDVRGEARAREAVGLAYMNLREPGQALGSFRRALALFRNLRDRAGEGRALSYLGALASFEGRNHEGLRYLDRAETILEISDDRRTLAHVLFVKGVLYRLLGHARRSESLLLAGIEIMRQIGDRVGEARGLFQLAATHTAMGKLRDAFHESHAAIARARKAKDIRAHIMFLNNAAFFVYRCLGDFNRAEQCVVEALRLVAEAGHAENTAIYHDTLAKVLIDRGDLAAALVSAKRSQMLYGSWPNRVRFIGMDISFRLGSIYLELGEHTRALTYLTRAASYWRRSGELQPSAHAEAAIARLFLSLGNVAGALSHAREAGRILRKIGDAEQIQAIYWSQHQVFREAGARAAARRVLRLAHLAVMQQASTLKGRMRRRFLTEVRVNREILEEVARTQRFRYKDIGAAMPQPVYVTENSSSGNGMKQSQVGAGKTGSNGRQNVEARRRALLEIIRGERITQRDLAGRLGVSARTIRSDVSALRKEGLLASRSNRSSTVS